MAGKVVPIKGKGKGAEPPKETEMPEEYGRNLDRRLDLDLGVGQADDDEEQDNELEREKELKISPEQRADLLGHLKAASYHDAITTGRPPKGYEPVPVKDLIGGETIRLRRLPVPGEPPRIPDAHGMQSLESWLDEPDREHDEGADIEHHERMKGAHEDAYKTKFKAYTGEEANALFTGDATNMLSEVFHDHPDLLNWYPKAGTSHSHDEKLKDKLLVDTAEKEKKENEGYGSLGVEEHHRKLFTDAGLDPDTKEAGELLAHVRGNAYHNIARHAAQEQKGKGKGKGLGPDSPHDRGRWLNKIGKHHGEMADWHHNELLHVAQGLFGENKENKPHPYLDDAFHGATTPSRDLGKKVEDEQQAAFAGLGTPHPSDALVAKKKEMWAGMSPEDHTHALLSLAAGKTVDPAVSRKLATHLEAAAHHRRAAHVAYDKAYHEGLDSPKLQSIYENHNKTGRLHSKAADRIVNATVKDKNRRVWYDRHPFGDNPYLKMDAIDIGSTVKNPMTLNGKMNRRAEKAGVKEGSSHPADSLVSNARKHLTRVK